MGFLDRYSGPLLSILRIVSGLLFLEHGTAKLLAFPPTEMFAQAPAVGSMIWIAGVLELVGGALLTIGLFTRPAAFVLAGEMAVAYWTAHAANRSTQSRTRARRRSCSASSSFTSPPPAPDHGLSTARSGRKPDQLR
jgi:uncharacterized membrane protein YphA (DoxX/SURF4 family)